ncbi:MAG: hypothetical protein IJL34_07685, partial [Treponema sp.]|nr:hypothetical protein [Treponema sp.]
MKKLILLLLTSILLVATACASGNTDTVVSTGSTTRGDTMNITITIMNATGKTHTLNATLAENKSAVAFAELLKKGAVTV